MPTAANIVIADAQATPVNHTFVPIGPDPKDSSIFIYEDQSQATQAGFWRVTIQVKRPELLTKGGSATRANRVVVSLHQPVLETLGTQTVSGIVPAPTVSYIVRSFAEFVIPERSSLQNRKDSRKMLALALADAQVIAAVESLLPIY